MNTTAQTAPQFSWIVRTGTCIRQDLTEYTQRSVHLAIDGKFRGDLNYRHDFCGSVGYLIDNYGMTKAAIKRAVKAFKAENPQPRVSR